MHAIGTSALVLATGMVAGLAAATTARAQSIGYVETLGGNISSAVDYNSAGGSNSLAVIGTGLFQVTLPGLGNGIDSNVQVNAVETNGQGHYCTSDGWFSSNGVDVTADVACFDASGNPLLADFSLFYQARTSPPPSGAMAFLWGDQPGIAIGSSYAPDASYSYNSTGGGNSVTHEGTGIYFAFLPGFRQSGNVQVTAYGGSAARCEVADWYQNRAGANVSVYCVNAAGAATDGYFSLSYTVGTTEAAGPAADLAGGVCLGQQSREGALRAGARAPVRRHLGGAAHRRALRRPARRAVCAARAEPKQLRVRHDPRHGHAGRQRRRVLRPGRPRRAERGNLHGRDLLRRERHRERHRLQRDLHHDALSRGRRRPPRDAFP